MKAVTCAFVFFFFLLFFALFYFVFAFFYRNQQKHLKHFLFDCENEKATALIASRLLFIVYCLFVYEHYNMIIVLGDPQLAKLFWAGHLS